MLFRVLDWALKAVLEREQGRKDQYKKAGVDERHEEWAGPVDKNIAALRANLAAAEKKMEEKRQEAEEAKRAIEENAAIKVAKARGNLHAKFDKDMVAMNEAAKPTPTKTARAISPGPLSVFERKKQSEGDTLEPGGYV
ncbi:MAG: hypothetical protein M1826_001300 [Phylliscum demangeonii]|nr:MAG: hypothetical protein M1826_001300 [Phylliscum demangeonii]